MPKEMPKELKVLTPAESYKDLMEAASEAQKNGEPAEALALYERAAKADPAKKQPWLRIAQAQFDARNYGTAIIAAQEVQQRDNADVTAKSILAASGLRVAARALEQLRAANADVVNTLEEARSLARTMRDALGEPILPAAEEEIAVRPTPRPAARRPAAAPAVSPSTAAPVAAPRPAAAPAPAPRRNPFDALKD
jgi:tetratricopeptide (TPR) repeat protein